MKASSAHYKDKLAELHWRVELRPKKDGHSKRFKKPGFYANSASISQVYAFLWTTNTVEQVILNIPPMLTFVGDRK